MKEAEKKNQPIPLLDDPKAPVFFATDHIGLWLHEGVIQFSFETASVDHSASPGPINRQVSLRVAMPVGAAQRLYLGLFNFLKLQGLDPTPALQEGPMQ